MKFLHSQPRAGGAAAFVFQINQREKDRFLATLQLYPVLEAGYHQITRGKKPAAGADQRLLEESMAQQRQDYRRKLEQFLASPRRFVADGPDQYRFTATGEQCEWLLQVLNEVRVGSWVKLGQPEMQDVPRLVITEELARYAVAMELGGFFQMVLLEAFKGKL